MLSVGDIRALKGKRQLVELNVASAEQAAAAEAAGIDMIVSGNRANRAACRAAAPDTHFCFGLVYGHHATADEARRAAFEAMEAGADSIYCAMNFDIVEAMAKDAIPVVGHVGLIPQKARWTGFRAVGKTAEEALRVLDDVRRYEAAGAFAVEMEVVPEPVAGAISAATPLTVISMGSGAGCDVQYLFAVDVLGETLGKLPRHARAYRDFAAEHARLQAARIAAFSEFRDDVRTGAFPAPTETVGMAPTEWRAFQTALDQRKAGV
ncbi:MAG: 3-methyl-2-oxobutanoate hydroxymethyltransferase [Rhodobacteraceae bacterium HLUCCA08]|nr:MAG: 3-methyl-2-oxobutanoate hydroxymethyltransferase [Rhodobacteraceae bacterium HLUCCA08]